MKPVINSPQAFLEDKGPGIITEAGVTSWASNKSTGRSKSSGQKYISVGRNKYRGRNKIRGQELLRHPSLDSVTRNQIYHCPSPHFSSDPPGTAGISYWGC
jgi:hypothetical protein